MLLTPKKAWPIERFASERALIGMRANLFSCVTRRNISSLVMTMLVVLTACSSNQLGPEIQSGQAAYTAMDASTRQGLDRDYRIGPLDTIDINVFQEPDLSVKELEVDASGNVSLPLIGPMAAGGKTTTQLSRDIAARLTERYLRSPQVSVTVGNSASQKVTVEGEVTEPGVYETKGRTSLLQTLALAKGETRTAALNQVVIFRTINGQRMGAVFDVSSIRSGRAPDPEILGNDIVVVGFSRAKSLWRDILSTTPILNMFRPIIP